MNKHEAMFYSIVTICITVLMTVIFHTANETKRAKVEACRDAEDIAACIKSLL